jgi:hypothetical protein
MKKQLLTASFGMLLISTIPFAYADKGRGHDGDNGGSRGGQLMTIDDARINNLLVSNGVVEGSDIRIKHSGRNGERVRIEIKNRHHDEEDEDEMEFEHGNFLGFASTTFPLPVVPNPALVNATATREMLQIVLPDHLASTTVTYGDAINSFAGYKAATQNIARYIVATSSAQASFSASLIASIDQMIASLAPLGVSNTIGSVTEKTVVMQKLDDVSSNVRALYRAVLLSLQ